MARRKTTKPSSALIEAARIARDARDAAIEIDWAENPASDEEERLRLAIIARIEVEELGRARQHEDNLVAMSSVAGIPHRRGNQMMNAALHIKWRLEEIADSVADAPEIGADLCDALEKWETIYDGERAKEKATEQRELRLRAVADVRQAAP
jgi:hypothetical protein